MTSANGDSTRLILTPDQPLRVFVSSTLSLVEGRRAQLQGSLGERSDPVWAEAAEGDVYAAADGALAAVEAAGAG